jgi:hypothetical protein
MKMRYPARPIIDEGYGPEEKRMANEEFIKALAYGVLGLGKEQG